MSRNLKPRVLCIDDEPIIGRFLQAALEQTGNFIVASETNPFNALEIARRFRPDLLVIDVNMPGQNGFAVARLIRKEPWLRDRPIVFFSGMDHKAEVELKAREGPVHFLRKGVSLEVILETVTRVAAERLALYTRLNSGSDRPSPREHATTPAVR